MCRRSTRGGLSEDLTSDRIASRIAVTDHAVQAPTVDYGSKGAFGGLTAPHHGRRTAGSNRTLPPIRAGPRTGTALHFNNFVEKRINRSHPKNAVVSNYKNGRINRALTPLLDRSSPMKTVARISLVALLLAGFATPASAAQTAAPARHDDSASSFGRPIQDWCIFPPSPWCDRKMNRWFD